MATGYDYVIVGAGSAGCVIAHRLVTQTDATVLLIEAGAPDDRWELHDEKPSSLFTLWAPGQPTDYGYVTEPQSGLHDRAVAINRGKTWGGSSSVNAMLFVRGNRKDFDGWAAAGNAGWAYDDVLPLFRRMETFQGGGSDHRGDDGPLSVITHNPATAVSQVLFDAAPEVGLTNAGPDFDYNAGQQEGTVFFYQATKTPWHQRSSTAVAFLHPVLDRPNLTVRSNATASRIVIENGRATGVEFIVDGRTEVAMANQEVIVSAGAFGSPQLLMLSGLGPQAELREHGLDVLVDLPGVGQNLIDHMIFGVGFLNKQEQPFDTTIIAETGFFSRSSLAGPDDAPDIQMKSAGLKFVNPQYDRPGDGFTFAPVLCQPKSVGWLGLASADPTQNARVQPNYLSDPADVQVFVESIELARELAHTRAYADWVKEEIAPGPEARTRDDLAEYVRSNANTLWHPVGTCAMGIGEQAVVDAELKVRGIQNLRVADASVMPTIVTGNTNAACIMIGEKAADLILAAQHSPRPSVQQQEPVDA